MSIHRRHKSPGETKIVRKSLVRTVSNWSYANLGGVEWDAQPACFITNYILAAQCFICGFHIIYNVNWGENTTSKHSVLWYGAYFVALGLTAAMGGILHHLAYKALQAFKVSNYMDRVKILGIYVTRHTVDRVIDGTWRMVLGLSSVSHFALFSLSAQRYFTETVAVWLMVIAALCYLAFIVWSTILMDTFFLLVGFLPALVFLGFTSIIALEAYGIIALVLKLSSGIVQGIGLCPSKKHFNHNALAHVLLSIAAGFMMYNYNSH